jgi:hypothetical protein
MRVERYHSGRNYSQSLGTGPICLGYPTKDYGLHIGIKGVLITRSGCREKGEGMTWEAFEYPITGLDRWWIHTQEAPKTEQRNRENKGNAKVMNNSRKDNA